MKRIQESEIENYINSWNGKDLWVEMYEPFKQKIVFQKAEIRFFNHTMEMELSDDVNQMIFPLSRIESILVEQSEIKFVLENHVEIYIHSIKQDNLNLS